MKTIHFYSDHIGRTLRAEGIVKIPLLEPLDIEGLLAVYNRSGSRISGSNFHSTMFVGDSSYRKKISDNIKQIITPKIDKLLSNYKLLFANFIIKEPGGNTTVGIHQDWNFTSPDITSFNVWIPLVDINEETGIFYALKGSHHSFQNLRYTPYEVDRYRHLEPYIMEHSSTYHVKAGEALVYDGAMIHFSDPNRSRMARIAIGMALIPAEAPNLHYYKRHDDKTEVEVYEVDEAFYETFDFLNEPKEVKKIAEINNYKGLPSLLDLTQEETCMYPVFKNKEDEAFLSQRGYVVIRQFLPVEKCDELGDFFDQQAIADTRAFAISNWTNNQVQREAIFNKICATLEPYVLPLLNEYKSVLGVFTAKRPMSGSDMLLHQDWSLVDEARYRSVSIWVALCDMDNINGNLEVAECSHLYATQPRGMNMPIPFELVRDEIQKNHLKALAMKKGDAIVFDHRLIHTSPENRSSKIRLAAVLALIPDEARFIHYYKHLDNDEELELLALSREEFWKMDFFDMPNKPKHISSLGMIQAKFKQITKADILHGVRGL